MKIKIKDQENKDFINIIKTFEQKLESVKMFISNQNLESNKVNRIQIREYHIHNQYIFRNGLVMLNRYLELLRNQTKNSLFTI